MRTNAFWRSWTNSRAYTVWDVETATALGSVPMLVPEAVEELPREPGHMLRVSAFACSAALMVLGAAVLVGWVIGSESLVAVLPGYASMKANTAACFLISGGSLALALSESAAGRRWSQVLGALVGGCGVLTLIEFLLGLDLHIDQALFNNPQQPVYPGRMAYVTAACFSLGALSLILMHEGRIARFVSQVSAFLVGAVAFVSMVGYLYGVPVLYGSMDHASMALHTGFGFLILGAGIVMARPGSTLAQILSAPEAGGWLARRLLPGVLVVPVALGWFYLSPVVTFGHPRFGMALFAVTLVASGIVALWGMAHILNRLERQRVEMTRVREQSAAAISQSERELRLVTDHLPTLLAYIDPDWRLLRVNRTYEQWLGRPADTIVGQTVRELAGELYWESTRSQRDAVFRGEIVTFEADYPTLRGLRRVEVTYAPDIDASGEIGGIACMVLDVDDRRRAEAALRQSEKLAVVGRLASSIAHEINNPLEAVTNLLYLAEQETAGHSTAMARVMQAQQELARVTHIVTQTLRFHRQSTSATLCSVDELFEDVLALYQVRLGQFHIQVDRRFGQPAPLLCREGELRQVLANLVANASDAMKAGGRLLVRARGATNWRTGVCGVLMTVADTGHGIDPETRARLFEPFHTTKGDVGSGLGLWVSKEIVDRHQGSFRVRSSTRAHAHGSVFEVFIPHALTRSRPASDSPSRSKPHPQDSNHREHDRCD